MKNTLHRSHSLLDVVRLVNMAFLTVKSESDVYERICATLVRAEDTCSCWIGLVEPGTCIVKPVAQAGFEDAHIPSMKVASE